MWLRVWLLLIAVYALLGMGYVDTTDAAASVEAAIALVETGSPRLVPERVSYIDSTMIADGKRGGRFSKMGIAMPLLYVPAVLLAKVVPLGTFSERQRIDFFVSLVSSFLTASAITLLFVFLQRSGHPHALLFALLAGFATLLLPYSKSAHREPIQALCLLALFGSLIPESRPRYFFAGLALGVGLLAKQVFLVPALPAIGWAAWLISRDEKRARSAALFFAPVFALVALWPLYSYLAWEAPFFTGYSPQTTSLSGQVWRTAFLDGVIDQLLSSRKGLVLYDPMAAGLLAVALVAWVRRRLGAFDSLALASISLQVALYAKWISPAGHEALGPRYLVVVIPLLFLIARGFSFRFGPWGRRVATTVVVACVTFQIVQTSVKMQQYYTLQNRSGTTFSEPQWRMNFRLFAHKIAGRPERYPGSFFSASEADSVDVTDVRSFEGLNFWWWHLWRNGCPDCRAELSSL